MPTATLLTEQVAASRGYLFGAMVWLALATASDLNWIQLSLVEILFLLAPWVIVPAALTLIPAMTKSHLTMFFRIQRWILFATAAICAASFLRPAGIIAALMASCWLLVCLCIAWGGVRRLLTFRSLSFPEFCVAVGECYIAVGGVWLVMSRAGLQPAGFQEPIVLLTAVHFHFAGFLSCIFASLTCFWLQSTRWAKPLRIVLLGTLFGPGLLGIAFMVGPRLKLIAVMLIVLGQCGLAVGMARIGAANFLGTPTLLRPADRAGRISRRAGSGRLAGFFLITASACVVAAMIYAATWALGEFPLQPMTDLSHMERIHGVLNAVGFGAIGLLGWIRFHSRNLQMV